MSEGFAYVALVVPCGCLVAAAVDEPEYAEENADLVADKMRRGFRIERLPVDQVRRMPMGYPCDHMKASA